MPATKRTRAPEGFSTSRTPGSAPPSPLPRSRSRVEWTDSPLSDSFHAPRYLVPVDGREERLQIGSLEEAIPVRGVSPRRNLPGRVPGPDRVRRDTKQRCGLGDREVFPQFRNGSIWHQPSAQGGCARTLPDLGQRPRCRRLGRDETAAEPVMLYSPTGSLDGGPQATSSGGG